MMRQAELVRGTRAIRGWISAMGTNGVPVSQGARVSVPSEGEEPWMVQALHGFGLTSKEVKAQSDRARGKFTAQESFRGNK
jgi:hypothetical protein